MADGSLRTARLELAPVTTADQPALHALFIQPGVRRVIFDDEIVPLARTVEIVDMSRALFSERGFGLWGARRHETDVLIGFGGLWHFREPPELELLYGVDDACTGRGIGREIAEAIVHYAFETLTMHTVRASTHPSHVASIRVLETLGFTFERRDTAAGLDTVFYELHAAAHRERQHERTRDRNA